MILEGDGSVLISLYYTAISVDARDYWQDLLDDFAQAAKARESFVLRGFCFSSPIAHTL